LEKKTLSLKKHYSGESNFIVVARVLLIYASLAKFSRQQTKKRRRRFLFAIFSRVHNVLLLYRFSQYVRERLATVDTLKEDHASSK